jgi:RNA polymerase sigma-70 factor (ECF subfamily)
VIGLVAIGFLSLGIDLSQERDTIGGVLLPLAGQDLWKSHMTATDPIVDLLVLQARAGDEAALGRLLELYRNYLRLMARSLIHQPLQVQLDASDLVQETFLKAHREFRQFAGSGEPELVAWLRRILVRTLSNQARHHRTGGRDQRRQESLDVLLDRSSLAIQRQLADSIASPSALAVRREQSVLVVDALSRLPEDHREVFILRNVEQVPFDEIATRMGRSPNAVRKLWRRVMVGLKQVMEEHS